ncbi:MAG: hypothetical protein KKA05_01595 [Alphaproteobacteria bacterium]|nr:hypothetical protein [Alphaproteobacteria bacterium]
MKQGKIFHISDILTVALGNTVVFTEELTMPDGTTRPSYPTNTDGIIDVIAHVTGHELRNPQRPSQYDLDLMMHLAPHAGHSLLTQLPWLRDTKFPDRDLPRGDRNAALQFCRDWVMHIAAKQGREWFEIHEDPEIGRVHKVTLGGPRP